MIHSFDVDTATKFDVYIAIFLQFFAYWDARNEGNAKHFHDGRYWTYNSIKAYETLFPYLTNKQIRRILKDMEDKDLIVSGYYNQQAYDRTKWYALTDKGKRYAEAGKTICPDGQNQLPQRANGSAPEGEPIPLYNHVDTHLYNSYSMGTLPKETVETVLSAWNGLHSLGISSVTKLLPKTNRYKMLKERIEEYGLDAVLSAIANIKKSQFLQGQNNQKWRIDFEWFVRPNNFPKVLEGKYTDADDDAAEVARAAKELAERFAPKIYRDDAI